jgi:UDPglucose 6-dehydrogenase/GDP-mannose 6-dehydrogenase
VRVAIVGAGYVGLVTGACLADQGHEIACIDVDEELVRAINEGRAPIHEPGLDALLARNAGVRLTATTELRAAVGAASLSMIAVGTPFQRDRIDLTAVRTAAQGIGEALRGRDDFHTVCVKSTVVPGTTDTVVGPVVEESSGRQIGVDLGLAMNPEFLTEGQALDDFLNPDRLVFGAVDAQSLAALEELYADFSGVPRIRTNTRTAEAIKYASNALLATMISFSNEVADLCSAVGGIDALEVMQGVHASRYLTPLAPEPGPVQAPLASFLEAGCGFGGSCLPKDVRALVAHGRELGVGMQLLEAVVHVNERRADQVLARLQRHIPSLRGARVTVLGLAFKPDTDDVRESPAFPIIERLLDAGATVTVHDPAALPALPRLFDGRARAAASLEDAVRNAEAVVIATRWREYEALPQVLAKLGPEFPLVMDGRRMLHKESVPRYDGIGL